MAWPGFTVTDATGTGDTSTVTAPATRSTVAEMLADPTVIAVTRPLVDTVATAGLDVLHLTSRPETGVPPEVLGVAANC